LFAVCPLTASGAAYAQPSPQDLSEDGGFLRRVAKSNYSVIALRVEFQPDSSRFSTGDGTFSEDMFQGLVPRIDPFPHDAAYFDAHLEFLETYVSSVSNGMTTIETHLIPEVITVSGQMSRYSPLGPEADSPEERRKLAELVAEAWTLADTQSEFQLPSGIDPDATAFILFHPGTGRDIELTGTALDRTPEDIPSLFFDTQSIDRLLGQRFSFKGIEVTSTAVVPATESKRGVDFITGEPFLLELSINGLLAASFLNFLGVPDLFDTSSGQSAIGPYGLMDPFGIFAYGGLIPPEPSGWTKYYLGWTTPHVFTTSEPTTLDLDAGVEVAIAPVSSSEYFLAETRHRDPGGDELNVVAYLDGEFVERRFAHDADDFNAFDQSGFEGVLVSVDDYDWALPGGFDTSGELRLGGMLIWHVDDNRLRAGLPTNSVNADPRRRALDLEEADSAQDLGFPNNNPFAPEFDRGTPFDFYFRDNPVAALTESGEIALYTNRFSSDTWPNSNSNGGGPSFVVLEDFSDVSTTMTLTHRRESHDSVQPVESLAGSRVPKPIGPAGSVSLITLERGPAAIPILVVHDPDLATAWYVFLETGQISEVPGVVTKPAVTQTLGASKHVAYLFRDENGDTWFTRLPPGQGPPQILYPLPQEVSRLIPSTPLVALGEGADEGPSYAVGYEIDGAGGIVRINPAGESILDRIQTPVRSISVIDDELLAVVEDARTTIRSGSEIVSEWTYPPMSSSIGQSVFGHDAAGLMGVIPRPGESTFLLLEAEGTTREVRTWSTPMSAFPVLADLDLDGLLDVVYASGKDLEAVTQAGAVVDDFPVSLPDSAFSQPLVARWSDDQKPGVLVGLADGYLHAFSVEDAASRPGFPLPVGGEGVATPILIDSAVYACGLDGNRVGGSSLGREVRNEPEHEFYSAGS
jgi:hypothetical protein